MTIKTPVRYDIVDECIYDSEDRRIATTRTIGWTGMDSERLATGQAIADALNKSADLEAKLAEVEAESKAERERREELEVVAAALYLGHDDAVEQFDMYAIVYLPDSKPAQAALKDGYSHDRTPEGFEPCTREAGHEGPCALKKTDRLREALEMTVKKYDKGDNGMCAVCRIGHRLYDNKGNIGVCSWHECLSHIWHAAITASGKE